MKNLIWTWSAIAGIALLAAPSAAEAQIQTKDWLVCGGNSTTFSTCASVFLTVERDGFRDVEETLPLHRVSMKIWNLSGMGDSYAGGIFTKIGFFHEDFTQNPGGIEANADGNFQMWTHEDNMVGDATAWQLANPNNAGGVYLDIASHNGNGVNNGIASGCDPSLNPADAKAVWENPCLGDSFVHDADANPDGWINMSFDVVGEWDLATTEMLIFVQNGPDGPDDSLQCVTGGGQFTCDPVRVPEPTTWLLLATGLAGLGFVSIRRRRESEFDLTA